FMAALPEEGTTSVAASFALMTAARSRRSTWLVELDLCSGAVFDGFEAGFAADVGRPGRAYDASLGLPPIYDILGPATPERKVRTKLLAVHQISGTRLLATRFRTHLLGPRERVRLSTRPDWWAHLRRSADWIIADAPCLARSGAGLAVAAQMDGVVLVVQSDRTPPEAIVSLREEVEDHGGHVLGIVMTGTGGDARLVGRFAS
ncbi:MAG: hypothetical protein AAGJ50_15635, partial [Pseudomonadota bacterium]